MNKATCQTKLNFKKVTTTTNSPEGVAAAEGGIAQEVQDAKPGIMKPSASEGVKFKRKKDALTTPSPALGSKKGGSGVSWGGKQNEDYPTKFKSC